LNWFWEADCLLKFGGQQRIVVAILKKIAHTSTVAEGTVLVCLLSAPIFSYFCTL